MAVAVKAAIGMSKKFLDPAQAAVFGAKIVSPLRNAVRLVDHDIVGPAGRKRGHERFIAEPFRRDIEETATAGRPVVHRLLTLGKRNMAVQNGRRDAGELEFLDLVVHQADQGRHDQAVLLALHGGKLVAQRFAAPRGHDPEQVAAPCKASISSSWPG